MIVPQYDSIWRVNLSKLSQTLSSFELLEQQQLTQRVSFINLYLVFLQVLGSYFYPIQTL